MFVNRDVLSVFCIVVATAFTDRRGATAQELPPQLAFHLPPNDEAPTPSRTLTLDHVLHRSSSAYGNLLRRKTLDAGFLKAAEARSVSLASSMKKKKKKKEKGLRPDAGDDERNEDADADEDEDAYGDLAGEYGFEHDVTFREEPKVKSAASSTSTKRGAVEDGTTHLVPDHTNKATILSIAKMSFNAYLEVGDDDWRDPGGKVLTNSSFGWEADGLRGYVFSDASERLVVIAIKGTSLTRHLRRNVAGVDPFEKDGDVSVMNDTVAKDKFNDNRFFSCCCARVSWTWTPVCDCYRGPNQCDQSCVEDSVVFEDSYYQMALDLYVVTTRRYPDSTIWMTGHSLGGAMASLTALTFGAPSVTFESPGDALPALRLHLPSHPGYDMRRAPHWAVGHTADPVFTGTCNGFSPCALGGYALESKCHFGRSIVYDTVADYGWRVDLRNHRIKDVLDRVLTVYDQVPPAVFAEECVDCEGWSYT